MVAGYRLHLKANCLLLPCSENGLAVIAPIAGGIRIFPGQVGGLAAAFAAHNQVGNRHHLLPRKSLLRPYLASAFLHKEVGKESKFQQASIRRSGGSDKSGVELLRSGKLRPTHLETG